MRGYKLFFITIIVLVIIVCAFNIIYLQLSKITETDSSTQDTIDFNTVYAQASTRDPSQLIARAINGEARGEPYLGQVAVGAVIINRTKHPSFPKTIASVIYQPGAFTAVSDGQINVPLSVNSSAAKAAKDCMSGWDPSDGAIYYYNPAKTTNAWIWSRPVIKVIGKHRFAK